MMFKKCIFGLMLALLVFAVPCSAGPIYTMFSAYTAVTSGPTSNGIGAAVNMSGTFSTFTCQANINSGTPTAVTVVLNGNLVGSAYGAMGSHAFTATELTANVGFFTLQGIPANQIKGQLSVLTGAGSITMYCTAVK
jgi:hypothetical protein